ncbi:hypothetical protein [Cellulophaga omnivescoria]|uniref:hypothetical protein n=1 Tax=Cellulophaga omnivescoria TaxID=1888890 RepID=UPI0022F01174|nr:hypothetical protein [Cellulophaga omnivescoria]WBU90846.1 hypothetical protein PBN93_07445 [Cellulophaga omnivescoria]
MKSENASVFYQSKKEKVIRILVFTILLLFFIGLSTLSLTMFMSFFDGKTITDIKSIFFLIFMSIILLSPVVISIYLLLMIYNQFKQNKVICTINNNNIYVSDYAIWIRKPTTILANTKIPLSDIKSVETKKVLFKTIIKLNFTLDKYNMLKGKINSSLNRISAKDKEFFKSRIEALLNYNQNI